MLVKLKDIAKIVSGGTPSTKHPEYYNGEIFWFTPYDLSNNKDFKYISKSDRKITKLGFEKSSSTMIPPYNILLTSRAPIGYLAINKNECCTNQGFKSLIINKQLADIDYIYYWLKYNIKKIENLGAGTTFKELSKNNLENVEIELPSLNKQKEISKILNLIDNQIEINYSVIKRLQVMGQAIFNRWFLQFKYPNNDSKFAFNDKLKKKIPVGWEVKSLTDIIKWESSSQPPKSTFSNEYKEGYIRFIQNRDYDSQDYITFIPLKSTTKTCTKFDIMMDKYGEAGKIRCGLDGAYNVALAKIIPQISFSNEYIRQFLMLESTYRYLNNACTASTRASLNEKTLSGLLIVIPSKNILEKFETVMKKLLTHIFVLKKFNNKLESLKTRFLPLLINGQIEIN